jgi:hypothetical protein
MVLYGPNAKMALELIKNSEATRPAANQLYRSGHATTATTTDIELKLPPPI